MRVCVRVCVCVVIGLLSDDFTFTLFFIIGIPHSRALMVHMLLLPQRTFLQQLKVMLISSRLKPHTHTLDLLQYSMCGILANGRSPDNGFT